MHEAIGSAALLAARCKNRRRGIFMACPSPRHKAKPIPVPLIGGEAESGRNSAFYNRCAIDLPSSVPWHGVDQFLASKIYPIGFKQPDWRYSSRPFCHSSSGPSPHQRLAAGQLDALDRASNVATVGLLIWGALRSGGTWGGTRTDEPEPIAHSRLSKIDHLIE